MTDETGTTERVARAAICEDPGMKTVDEVAAQKGKSQVVKGLLH
jgi:phage I-like protein